MVCIMISWHTVFRQLPRAKKRHDVWQRCSITDNSLDINKWLLFLFVALCCPLFRLPKKSELQGYEPSAICFPIVKLSPKCWTSGLTYLLLGNKHIYSKSSRCIATCIKLQRLLFSRSHLAYKQALPKVRGWVRERRASPILFPFGELAHRLELFITCV